MDVLDFLLRLPDALNLVFASIRFWRITVSVLIAICFVAVIYRFWEAAAIRWIAGFHILVLCTTAGVMWETNRE